ncbi:putative anti-sigma regulatory factor, serine/threonine protein kinase, partial [Actinobacteria bacterium OK074]
MAPPSLPQSIGRSPGQERPVRAGIFGLPAATTSVRLARGHVRALLVEWNSGAETCDNAVLVTSELVTNAVMHTASERIVCRLRADGDAIRIEVEDESRGPSRPVQRLSRPDDQGGRGLLLVGMLSSDWGVKDSPHGHGRIVWAELPYQAEGAETPPGADDDRGDYDRSDYDYADGDLSDCIDDGDPADRPAADRHAWADAARSTRTDAARTNGTSGTGRDGRGSGGTVSLWTGMAPGRAATPATPPPPSRPAPSGPTPSGPAPTGPATRR